MDSCADVHARLGSRRWIVGTGLLELLMRACVRGLLCASWLCAVLLVLLALRMPLRTLVGWEAIVRA